MTGAWLFPLTAESLKDGNGKRRLERGLVRSDIRNLVSVGKNLLSLRMVYRGDDKNSYLNKTITEMLGGRCLTE